MVFGFLGVCWVPIALFFAVVYGTLFASFLEARPGVGLSLLVFGFSLWPSLICWFCWGVLTALYELYMQQARFRRQYPPVGG
jgi:hypothetical protein